MDLKSQRVSDRLIMTITVKMSSRPNKQRRLHPVSVKINRELPSSVFDPVRLAIEVCPSQSLTASPPVLGRPDRSAISPINAINNHLTISNSKLNKLIT